jgi:hypothetical protein
LTTGAAGVDEAARTGTGESRRRRLAGIAEARPARPMVLRNSRREEELREIDVMFNSLKEPGIMVAVGTLFWIQNGDGALDCTAFARAGAWIRAFSLELFTVRPGFCALPPIVQRTHNGRGTVDSVNT